MTITAWLEHAIADAEARELPALRVLLEGLARSTTALRAAPWNDDASGHTESPTTSPQTDAR